MDNEAEARLRKLAARWKSVQLFGIAELLEAALEGRKPRQLNSVTGKPLREK